MIEADIIARLVTAGVVSALGTDVFVGYMPSTPDNVVSVTAYGGSPPITTHDGAVMHRPSVQVRVRNSAQSTGWTKINSIYTALHGIANTTLNGSVYLLILANQEPQPMGIDKNGRWEFVQNFSLIKR
jgi:hypothetical protein